MKNEIAAPLGLAMTTCDVKIFNAFVLDTGPPLNFTAIMFYQNRQKPFREYSSAFIDPFCSKQPQMGYW